MQNIIKRDDYLNRIIDKKENGLILLKKVYKLCGHNPTSDSLLKRG